MSHPPSPLLPEAPGIPQDAPVALDGAGSPPLRVLILEDVMADARLMERELKKTLLPMTVQMVDNREAFLEAFGTFRPDLILSDFALPQFTALEALKLVRERDEDVPFILVTGSQSEEVAVQCMKEGADDYILKTSLKRLPTAVLNVVKKHAAEKEKRLAREALQKSEEHFRSLIENALDIITIFAPDGICRYASPSIRILGYAPEQFAGQNLFSLVAGQDMGRLQKAFLEALKHPEKVQQVEMSFRHRNGTWRVLEAIGKSIPIEADRCGIVFNARDITERKEQEAAIERMAAFPRLNPNPIFEISADGKLNYFNEAAAQMAQRLEQKHPSELLPVEASFLVRECLLEGKPNTGLETTVGQRILSWMFFPIKLREVVHCYATDITDRVLLEAQLRQSQKMESIGQLAAGVAHDFNNILTLIQGYSGLLLAEQELSDDVSESLQQISAATQRATNLTRQLLLFSRKQMLQLQDLDLNEVISDVAKLLRRILGEDVALNFSCASDLPGVHGDAGMIEQILMNLAVNSRDAMPRGGQLVISTARLEVTREHTLKHPDARPGTFVTLEVADNGAGIPPEILPRIFEPFFTTKDVGQGTGLGLATVYGIVKQHHGWIEVASRLQSGTSFKIFLPAVAAVEKEPETKSPAEKVRGGSETVLVVEDEPDLRFLVREVLEHYGYRVLEAGSGPEVAPVWEKHSHEIDLLLTDMVMPGNMTGKELADLLKAKKASLKIIFTSGYSMETVANEKMQFRKGVNFLPKPYPPLTLLKMVRDCLDG